MTDEHDQIVVSPGGFSSEGTIMGNVPTEIDEEALLSALYRMERRQARELKKLQEKMDKKSRRRVRESRRRNRQ